MYFFSTCVCLANVLPYPPLLFTGDSSEPDEHPSVRPYAPRENAPSYGVNNASSSTTDSSQQTHTHLSHPPIEDPLGPLPDNWEMAYTENGEVYFIEYVPCALNSLLYVL